MRKITDEQGIFLRAGAKRKRTIFSWENVSSLYASGNLDRAETRTPQTRMAATAWDMVSEKRAAAASSVPDLSRSASQHSDTPLIPENATAPGARFGGFGFGRQGEKAAAAKGFKISRPLESLPRESCGPRSRYVMLIARLRRLKCSRSG